MPFRRRIMVGWNICFFLVYRCVSFFSLFSCYFQERRAFLDVCLMGIYRTRLPFVSNQFLFLTIFFHLRVFFCFFILIIYFLYIFSLFFAVFLFILIITFFFASALVHTFMRSPHLFFLFVYCLVFFLVFL